MGAGERINGEEMDWITVVIVVGVTAAVISAFTSGIGDIEKSIKAIPGFADAMVHVDTWNKRGVAVSLSPARIALYETGTVRVLAPSDILGSELCVDGENLTTKSTGAQLGRALVGGVIFGPVGAVIGAMTAGSKTKSSISDVELRLTVKDLKKPTFAAKFHSGAALAKDGFVANSILQKATEWNDRVVVLMNEVDPTPEQLRALLERHDLDARRANGGLTTAELVDQVGLESVLARYGVTHSGAQFYVQARTFNTLEEAVDYARLIRASTV